MSLFDANSRDRLRLSYIDAWKKMTAQHPMSAQESAIANVIALHPEYQPMLNDPAVALSYEAGAHADVQNPFLHMGLHLAVRDQVAIDRPPGIRALHQRLQERLVDPHAAEHALMEALGQVLWQAQRDGRAPDEQQYLALAQQHTVL